MYRLFLLAATSAGNSTGLTINPTAGERLTRRRGPFDLRERPRPLGTAGLDCRRDRRRCDVGVRPFFPQLSTVL